MSYRCIDNRGDTSVQAPLSGAWVLTVSRGLLQSVARGGEALVRNGPGVLLAATRSVLAPSWKSKSSLSY